MVVHRDEARFAFAVVSSLERQPEGFVATFPDGGTPIVKEQKIRVWTADVSAKAAPAMPEKLAEIERASDIRSGLNVHCLGWDSSGAFYIRIIGRTGKTSDTAFVRHVVRISPDHSSSEVSLEPDLHQSLQSGPLVDHRLLVDLAPVGGNLQVAVGRDLLVNPTVVFRVRPDGNIEAQ
jgi:hypothetical protein